MWVTAIMRRKLDALLQHSRRRRTPFGQPMTAFSEFAGCIREVRYTIEGVMIRSSCNMGTFKVQVE